jgi:hypothetical protein
LLLFALGGVAALALGVPALVGHRHGQLADRDALLQAQGPGSWVVIGQFDERWPARMVATADGLGELSFEHRGVPQSYARFDGYRLRVVHLLDADEQAVTLVLRSASADAGSGGSERLEREDVEQGVRR